jgi:hypothetical protein
MEKKPNILKNVLVMGIVTLLFSVVTISMILVLGIKPSTQFYVFAGIVITAISGIFTAYINSNNAYKDELREVEKRITKNIIDIGDKYRAKFENIEDDVFKNQTEMSRKTNEFMIESVTSIKSDIKTIQQDFTEFKSEVKEIKSTLDEMTSIKEKREMWRSEINKDWAGCKKRIHAVDDGKTLSDVASIVKDSVFSFFENVIEIDDLSHCDDISVKEKSINHIYELLESKIVKTSLQLNSIHDDKWFISGFKSEAQDIISNYKSNIEKVFIKNTINSVYRNFYNYTSTFLNELLNMAVAVWMRGEKKD